MAGAGISTAAGIPDFRSPDTGLYDNLARLDLPFPEAVFEINFFRENPVPFYTLANELAPGRYRPTITHSFIRLLSEKGLLHTHFTQNIDTLERRAGVPAEDVVEAHGSFASSRCVDCKKPYDDDKMKEMIKATQVPRCLRCKGLVKPDIVFFGEALPNRFRQSLPTLKKADLLIVMGTSLTVHPFASLTQLVPPGCPRVLINLEPAGDIGERANDVVLLGHCDDIVRSICKELDWEQELEGLWSETQGTLDEDYSLGSEHNKLVDKDSSSEASKSDTLKSRSVDDLTERVREALQIKPRYSSGSQEQEGSRTVVTGTDKLVDSGESSEASQPCAATVETDQKSDGEPKQPTTYQITTSQPGTPESRI